MSRIYYEYNAYRAYELPHTDICVDDIERRAVSLNECCTSALSSVSLSQAGIPIKQFNIRFCKLIVLQQCQWPFFVTIKETYKSRAKNLCTVCIWTVSLKTPCR